MIASHKTFCTLLKSASWAYGYYTLFCTASANQRKTPSGYTYLSFLTFSAICFAALISSSRTHASFNTSWTRKCISASLVGVLVVISYSLRYCFSAELTFGYLITSIAKRPSWFCKSRSFSVFCTTSLDSVRAAIWNNLSSRYWGL